MKALDLAKYLVDKSIQDTKPISNLQLQKIMFYIQKDFLQKKGEPAFYADIEAWQFGPVVPIAYYAFCVYGANPIRHRQEPSLDHYSDILEISEIINSILVSKRQLKPWDLVKETHHEGGAWHRVYECGHGNRQIIPVQLIKEFG